MQVVPVPRFPVGKRTVRTAALALRGAALWFIVTALEVCSLRGERAGRRQPWQWFSCTAPAYWAALARLVSRCALWRSTLCSSGLQAAVVRPWD